MGETNAEVRMMYAEFELFHFSPSTRPLPQAVLTRARLSLVAEGDKQYSPG